MESYLISSHYDLVTPDGVITNIQPLDETTSLATITIEDISPVFRGFEIDKSLTFFNLKSTLAQLGLNGIGVEYEIDKKRQSAKVKVELKAYGKIAIQMLKLLEVGSRIGKLFSADDTRRVRSPDYLTRMFGRSDRSGQPLLSLGGLQGSKDIALEVIDGRAIAFLNLKNGRVEYEGAIFGLLSTLAKSLKTTLSRRSLLSLHQLWLAQASRKSEENEVLLLKSQPLHIRTVFGHVVSSLLPKGYSHTTASILEPNTQGSGDIYEVYGKSDSQVLDIPIEFYTLEPHREHVFFEDRDQLQTNLEDPKALFKAFETAPDPKHYKSAVFVVKGTQLMQLKPTDWIVREPRFHQFPGFKHVQRQSMTVEKYIAQQPAYPFLKAIEDELITSQGVMLTRYFPSILLKSRLLSTQTLRFLKRIYFLFPSPSHDQFFSHEDRAMLNDFYKFALPVFWVDHITGKILQYVQKEDNNSGMFVPQESIDDYFNSSVFGIYGSNLLEGEFEEELCKLLKGVLEMKTRVDHPLLGPNTPLSLITGGGPGAMAVGNRVAKDLNILSCANVMDFRAKGSETIVNEQRENPHIEAKMTYRLEQLVERQSEFGLDFPIFLEGGIGTDFEFSLEEVRRKVGAVNATPMLLFGSHKYWQEKITHRFQCNLNAGTIKGSEWVSNCFYCVQTAEQALLVYENFFKNKLPIGPEHSYSDEGFMTVNNLNTLGSTI